MNARRRALILLLIMLVPVPAWAVPAHISILQTFYGFFFLIGIVVLGPLGFIATRWWYRAYTKEQKRLNAAKIRNQQETERESEREN